MFSDIRVFWSPVKFLINSLVFREKHSSKMLRAKKIADISAIEAEVDQFEEDEERF